MPFSSPLLITELEHFSQKLLCCIEIEKAMAESIATDILTAKK
jgi:hypothetical protein